MTDLRCSRPFCFEQKIVSDRQFPLETQYNDAIFQQKQKRWVRHGDTTSNLFHQKKKASCHDNFLQKKKGSVCSREIFSFKK